jgi:DUF438 domain-containing protein
MIEQMSQAMVQAIWETLPMELTVIDANDEVAGWNKHGDRLFVRPLSSMGLNFRQCHPQKSLAMVEQLIEEMKAGTRDKADFWIDLPVGEGGALHKIYIEFYALRDEKRNYLGCMECTRDVDGIQKLEGNKRLLDE